ncbi:hypothetical protein ThidrDRAFT_3775 [Thiorhodococcus drewsii AZ1]|uniref:Uncharacterized protein n=1 Tax=Thiorhodococcus drewsii AZ1 TaxID=765913 RepID=G2E662_9GAMM|nr:hypothetical protein [Thiorhodococcus drewsii]EGV28410.1 hypothetical protein ThidrDRAFT_3775 [Thiorhodococcus drewsii AZ1]
MNKRRNPVARSPLLRKGGPHVRSASSIRAGHRRAIEDGIDAFHGLDPVEPDRVRGRGNTDKTV